MKRTILASLIFLSMNAHADGFVTGRVIEIVPVQSQNYQPQRSCHWEERQSSYQQPQPYQQQEQSFTGGLIGAIAGGLAGAQVGKGNGRIVASAAGSAVGAMVGNHVAQQTQQRQQTHRVQVCDNEDNYQQQQATSFRIAVQVGNQFFRFTTMNRYSEGDQVEIALSARLVETGYRSQRRDEYMGANQYQQNEPRNQGRRLDGFRDTTQPSYNRDDSAW